MSAGFIWMGHPDAGVAQFPEGAREGWEARGWAACDAPPEPLDPALAEYIPPAPPAPVTTVDDDQDQEDYDRG